MDLLGSPQRSYPSIHIAGTNGKTSVARMVDALVTALHRRTGRTTSPHLQSPVERISIDGKPISPAQYVATYREIEPLVALIDQQSQASAGKGGPAMSKFEVLTAMAFAAFADAPVDVAVVEVGMGGRWDATNVINAPVAVITPISIDHVDYLGADIAGIAGEKAGIITRAPTVRRTPSRSSGVRSRRSWRCCWPNRCAPTRRWPGRIPNSRCYGDRSRSAVRYCNCRASAGFTPTSTCRCTVNTRRTTRCSPSLPSRPFSVPVRSVSSTATPSAGFAAVTSPGRLERMRSAPTVFIDAAHNPAGASALAQTLAHEFDFRFLVGVLSVLGDKDVDGILAALEPVFDSVVVTHNGSPRALDVEALALAAGERFDLTGCAPPRTCAMLSTLPPHWSTTPPPTRMWPGTHSREPGSSSPARLSPQGRLGPCSVVIRNDRPVA